MTELPTGWEVTKIGEIVLLFDTVDPRRKPDETFVYVDIGSIDNQIQEIINPKILMGKDAPSRARRQIKEGDTLFSTVRTYLKNVALVPPTLDNCVTSTGIAILRPSCAIDPKFLFNFARSPEFLTRIGTAMDGTMYPAVTDQDVLDQEFLLPPLAEQRRIVAKLDTLFARTRQAREELEHIPALIEHYKQAILAAAFRGELTADWRSENDVVNDAWGMVCVGEVITDIRYGTAKKCGYEPNGTPVLRIPNVGENGIDIADLKYTELTESEIEKLALKAGDLLVVRSNGSVDLVGRVALVGEDIEGFAYAGYLIRLRPNSDKVAPGFLRWMLTAPQTRRTIEVNARSTSGVHNVNSQELQELVVPLTSIEEQLEIVQRIEDAMEWLDIVLDEATSALRLLDHLDQATLEKAFRGELVPQDPDDEPASALLERIRAARAEGSNSNKRKNRG